MSRENIEVVRKGFEALRKRDLPALLEAVDPELEWETELIGTPVYRGRAGVEWGLRDVETAWETFEAEPLEFVERGDQVMATVHVAARGRTTGADVQDTFYWCFTLRDHKVVRFQGFTEKSRALEAAGLRE